MYRAIFVLSPVLTLPCLTSSFLLASGVLGVVGSAGVTLTKLLMAFCKLSYAVSISVTVATSLAATAFTSIRILAVSYTHLDVYKRQDYILLESKVVLLVVKQ